MRNLFRLLMPLVLFVLSVALLPGSVVAAETKAVQTMAGILIKLNHFPDDAEKQALKKIVEDKASSAHERVVAQALTNVQHKVSADDKPKLDAVVKDESAPAAIKTLATVIVNLNHKPTEADQEKLKKLAAQ